MSRVRAPVAVPEDIVERVRALCLALPEGVTVRVDGWAQSFDIRRRSFCLLVAREGPGWQARSAARARRADPDEREALLSIGRPFFASRAGRDRVGVWLAGETRTWGGDSRARDRELPDSSRVLKKLTALLG